MKQVFYWSLVAALAGFLFGFDTVVISGADQKLQELWGSSDIFHGSVVMAMALWGTVFGAIFGGIPTRKFGRRTTLIWIGIFYTISAIGSAFANDPFTFAAFPVPSFTTICKASRICKAESLDMIFCDLTS